MNLTLRRPRPAPVATLLVVAAVAVVAGALLIVRPWAGGETQEPLIQTTQTSSFYDEQTFARAVARAESAPAQPMPGVRALIFPHHWLAGHLILSGLRDLAATGSYDRVILLGPDHTNSSSAAMTTSDQPWQTPFGLVYPDAKAVASLMRADLVKSRPDVLQFEHSIAGIVPAISYYLPGVTIVPLALQHSVSLSESRQLAEALVPLMDNRTILVAAEDFAHYLPAGQAQNRNTETLAALQSLDSPAILSYGDEHLDSPASIATLIETMRMLGASTFVERANTNSAEVEGSGGASVTSYITGYYH